MSVGDVDEVIELYRDVTTYNSAFNHDASDNMKALGLGELPPPASCFVCGSGSCEAGYLNFGTWAEFIGNLLICASCLVQAAEKIGCLAPSVKVLFEKNIRALQQNSQDLESQVNELYERNRALLTIVRSGDSTPDTDGSAYVVSEQEPQSDSEPTDAAGEGQGSDDSDSDESTVSEGPVHVTESATVDDDARESLVRL